MFVVGVVEVYSVEGAFCSRGTVVNPVMYDCLCIAITMTEDGSTNINLPSELLPKNDEPGVLIQVVLSYTARNQSPHAPSCLAYKI